MKIVAIHVEGFGTLGERMLRMDQPFVLMYGPNEAGKSTLTNFISSILFGFTSRGQGEGRLAGRYEPPGGGIYGGSLTLIDEQGQQVLVERYDRNPNARGRLSAGEVKVTFPDGKTSGEEALILLLGGISSELFRVLFAFGLTELQELRTLQKEEIGSYLYNAGLGIPPSAMIDGERKLTVHMERLYKPRGKNQDINIQLKSLDDIELAIRRSKDLITQYDEMKEEERSADIRILELDDERTRLQTQIAWLDTCMQARDPWLRSQNVEEELAKLPNWPEYPSNVETRYDRLVEEGEQLKTAYNECKLKLDQVNAFMEQLKPDDELLERKTEIESLLERIGNYQADLRSIDELRVESAQTEKELQRTLRLIDAKWDESSLESFPVSAANREAIGRMKQLLDELAKERNQLAMEQLATIEQRNALEEEREKLTQRIQIELREEAGVGLDSLAGKIGDPIAYLRSIAGDYASYKLLEQQCEHLRQRAEDRQLQQALAERLANQEDQKDKDNKRIPGLQRLLVPLAVMGIGIIGSIFLFAQENRGYAAALLGVSILGAIGIAGITFKSSNRTRQSNGRKGREFRGGEASTIPNQLDPKPRANDHSTILTEQLMHTEQSLFELRDGLQDRVYILWQLGSRDKDVYTWTIAKRWLDDEFERWQVVAEQENKQNEKRLLLKEKVADQEKQSLLIRKRIEKLEARVKANDDSFTEVNINWSRWLSQHAFSEPLSPQAVEGSLPLVEQGHSLLHQQRRLAAKLAAAEIATASYEAAATSLLGNEADAEPILGVKRQGEALAQELRRQEDMARASEERRATELQALSLRQRLEAHQLRLSELLVQAHAESESELRVNARLASRRADLEGERRHLLPALHALVSRQRLQELDAMLTAHGEAQLAARAGELTQQLAQVTREVNELRERRGLLAGEAAKLELGAEHSDKLQHREEQLAMLQQAGRDYAVHAFALHLLRKAREVYEQERQPGVLKRASEFFVRMTRNKFSGIRAPFSSEQKLEAVRPDGRGIDTAYLSRGTAEQLYLSMRFALAEEYAARMNLPLIMDDILVNFDDDRMEACLEVLNELSQKHQIILFTCHKHVRDATLRKLPELQLVEL